MAYPADEDECGGISGNSDILDHPIEDKIDVIIAPNPANSFVSFDLVNNYDIESISIVDLSGKVVMSMTSPRDNVINIQGIKPGIYFIKFHEKSGQDLTKKLIVQ